MSRIFLSHSSSNNREAVALRHWLTEQNPKLANEIFLDIDPAVGIRTGERWAAALRRANARCEAVVCLLSKDWESSVECQVEYRTAENLNKRVFCARLEDGTGSKTAAWQWCDLFGAGPKTTIDVGDSEPVEFATDGLYRLRDGIRGAGIGADDFVWPVNEPTRAPYRGWLPFDLVDAGIFYGRDAQIVSALDAVRGMRKAKIDRWFVVLGPSGAGKSSFLRAGLLPRLDRDDREFVVLGVVRPERDVLEGANGFAKSIYAARKAKGLTEPVLGDIEAACIDSAEQIRRLLIELQDAVHAQLLERGDGAAAPTLVLPLDQAEELLSADGERQAERFLRLVGDLTTLSDEDHLDLIVAATIRSDRFEGLQTREELADTGIEAFTQLRPMPGDQFKEVIVRPADRATEAGRRLELEPDLVDRILEDCREGSDTLPLLALTMARLYEKYGESGTLTLAQYERMGGLRRIVQNQIDEVLSADREVKPSQLEALRSAFIPWLVAINVDNEQPMRRVALRSDLPQASLPLIDAFVAKRLLIQDERDGQVVVEVALESLLRQWHSLADWIGEHREDFKTVDDLERTAKAWSKSGRDDAWLLGGSRLADAERVATKVGFRDRLAPTVDYLLSCRRREDALRQADLHRQRESIVRQLVSDAQNIIAGTTEGADSLAFQLLLAARSLQSEPDDAPLRDALLARATTRKIVELGDAAHAVAISPDGHRLATAGNDGAVRLWDTVTGHPIGAPLHRHTSWVNAVAFSPDGRRLASAGSDATLRLWDVESGHQIGDRLEGHNGAVTAVAFAGDGRRIVSGGQDATVRVWDVDTARPVGEPLAGHESFVFSVAFSPDRRHIASGGGDRVVRIWDVETGLAIGPPLSGHTHWIRSVTFSPDGRRIASGGDDRRVRIWDVHTGAPVSPPLEGHAKAVMAVAFSPDGRRLASAGDDRTVRLWDAGSGAAVGEPMSGHSRTVTGLAFGPDSLLLASASQDRTVRLWDVDRVGQPLVKALASHSSRIRGVAFSPDGRSIASAAGSVRRWWAASGEPIGSLIDSNGGWVSSVAYSRDGRLLVSGGADPAVRLWDATSGAPVGELIGHTKALTCVAFSPDSSRIVSGSDDKTVRVWDVSTGLWVRELTGHTESVSTVAFSPDGSRIASGGDDATVRLWNVESDAPAFVLEGGHTQPVTTVCFSPDGGRLLTASTGGTIRLWDVDSGEQIGNTLTGHKGGVTAAVFSPDGRRIASAGEDHTVRMWDAETGAPLGPPLTGHLGPVSCVAFSPDGRRLASGSWDRTVRVWLGEITSERLCDKLTHNMSREQWRLRVSADIEYIPSCPTLPTPQD